jgi:hypothetical protein
VGGERAPRPEGDVVPDVDKRGAPDEEIADLDVDGATASDVVGGAAELRLQLEGVKGESKDDQHKDWPSL